MKKNKFTRKNYNQFPRWVSYFFQIESVLKINPKKILEIGIGSGIVSSYLKSTGLNVKTCDIEKRLAPDIVADIRKLPFKKNSFDCILACEILEHIPYEDFKKVLVDLKRISKEYVIISVPYHCKYVNFMVRFSGIKHLFTKELFNLSITIPPFWANKKFDGYHYWEIGYKNYPLKKIKKDIRKNFIIEKCFKNPVCPYHIFFVLRKQRGQNEKD